MKYAVEEKNAGKKFKCKQCERGLTVPSEEPAVEPAEPPPPPEEESLLDKLAAGASKAVKDIKATGHVLAIDAKINALRGKIPAIERECGEAVAEKGIETEDEAVLAALESLESVKGEIAREREKLKEIRRGIKALDPEVDKEEFAEEQGRERRQKGVLTQKEGMLGGEYEKIGKAVLSAPPLAEIEVVAPFFKKLQEIEEGVAEQEGKKKEVQAVSREPVEKKPLSKSSKRLILAVILVPCCCCVLTVVAGAIKAVWDSMKQKELQQAVLQTGTGEIEASFDELDPERKKVVRVILKKWKPVRVEVRAFGLIYSAGKFEKATVANWKREKNKITIWLEKRRVTNVMVMRYEMELQLFIDSNFAKYSMDVIGTHKSSGRTGEASGQSTGDIEYR
ncbi:MAG: hypothetical protein ACYTHM_22785 [Planctomycetota bacterium]|jgi:hypothetical protein